ncbi:uncharacterized protein NEMAJ01_0660 [Nematocida major]|uniref:uncharacterized protein n=1 Tax=Nematocida major TaxID=1912982 RepID=UPI0020078B0A|nr:uncharacterized protein NEMAJ01_0660 [Nematocida major]KAH9385764.1 hypothetical protein NEMAJ01_0660 [Nematocida major]
MRWRKFVRSSSEPKEEWSAPETLMDRITATENACYFTIEKTKHALPIQDVIRVTPAQDTPSEYLINNSRIAIIFKDTGKIRKFFYIPAVIPETLTYYGAGLVAGISKTREEVISFTVGGPGADTEFSVCNYAVAVRLDNCIEMHACPEGLKVLHEEGVCVLRAEE